MGRLQPANPAGIVRRPAENNIYRRSIRIRSGRCDTDRLRHYLSYVKNWVAAEIGRLNIPNIKKIGTGVKVTVILRWMDPFQQ
jgi:hypothetical protein